MSVYKSLKEECYEANMEIPRLGLAIFTFGNVSAFDPDRGVYAIKPSGVPYKDLKADDIVIVDLNDDVVEGKLRPSSDTPTHSVLYQNFPDIRGIVHTHSTYAVAWSQAMVPIPIFGTTHADMVAGEVPCTTIISDEGVAGNYERETGNQILDLFKELSYKEIEIVLVACHGPFTWGVSAAKAVYNSAVLEEVAKMAFLTKNIRRDTPLLKNTIVDKHYQRKHGENAYYGQKKI
jgi:L-ribulose-5-phosphate 4-epimerase